MPESLELRASIKAAFKNPGLVLTAGIPADLRKHVAAAAALHPVFANLTGRQTLPSPMRVYSR